MNKNNSKMLLYILVVISIVLIGYLIFKFIIFVADNDNNNSNNYNSSNNNNVVNKVTKFQYKGYEYTLPAHCYYSEKKGNYIHIYNNVDVWSSAIKILDKNKLGEELFNDYDELESKLKISEKDTTIKNRRVMEFTDFEVVSFEEYHEEANNLIAYMPAYDNYEYEIFINDSDGKNLNYDALNVVIDMLQTGIKISDDATTSE